MQFHKNTENTDIIIIPEYRLENSQQINTVSTIISYKTNFASGKYSYMAIITKIPI